jgi:hypothetical protein
MSPKVARPDRAPDEEPDEPGEVVEPREVEESGLPPGHVPMARSRVREQQRSKPLPLWLKIGAYVLLLVLTVGVVWYLGRPADPRESAEGTAGLVAKSINDRDVRAFRSYRCDEAVVFGLGDWATLGEVTVLSVTDDDGRAEATLRSRGLRATDIYLELRERDDSWCVAGSPTPAE